MRLRMIQTVAAVLLMEVSVCGEHLTVLAASSTADAMKEIGTLFSEKTALKIRFSFASSGSLAMQILRGAPSDLFLSANEQWMDELEKGKKTDPETRTRLLSNRLVLIAPLHRPVTLDESFKGRLAVGSMESVAAGMCAKQVLTRLSLFEKLKSNFVNCESVRSVLFIVERGEADAGIVFSSDALISKRVEVMLVFPDTLHDPVCYSAAVCRDSRYPAAAREFLLFMRSPEAKAVFKKYGFGS